MSILLLTLLTFATPFVVSSIGTSDPYRFWINATTTAPIRVWNRGTLASVEKFDEHSVRMVGKTRAVLTTPKQTEVRLAMTAIGNEQLEGFRLHLRTTDTDLLQHQRQGITLVLDRQGLRILDEHQSILASTDTLRYHAGIPTRIAFEHDGQWTRIAVGCTLFGPFRTHLPATEATIVVPIGKDESSLLLKDIAFEAVRP